MRPVVHSGGLLHRGQHEDATSLPVVPFSHSPQSTVVFALVLDDVPAEIENRDFEQPGLSPGEQVENAPVRPLPSTKGWMASN